MSHPDWPRVRAWANERIDAALKLLETEGNEIEKVPAHRREIKVLRALLELENQEKDE